VARCEGEGDHAAEAVADDDRGCRAHHGGQVRDLLVERGAGAGRERATVAAAVVADGGQLRELASGASERAAAIERPVDQHDPGRSGRSLLLGHEEVGHGGAR
jgi:hypothetical protein